MTINVPSFTQTSFAAMACNALLNFTANAAQLTPEEVRAITRDACIYGFPLVDNYRSQHAYFQDPDSPEYKAPWNHRGKPAAAPVAQIDFPEPLSVEQARTSLEFFNILNFVLTHCPPHPSERALMERFAKLRIGAGQRFDAQALSPALRKAVEQGMADAW